MLERRESEFEFITKFLTSYVMRHQNQRLIDNN